MSEKVPIVRKKEVTIPKSKVQLAKKPEFKNLEPLVAWEAPSNLHYDKGRRWYIIAGTIVILLVLYFIITGSAMAAIATILLAGVYFLASREAPRMQKIEINDLGIVVNDKFYVYANIRYFWILYNPPITSSLHFALVGKVGQLINIQLGSQDPAPVRNFLRSQIPEVQGRKEGFFDSLTKLLRI